MIKLSVRLPHVMPLCHPIDDTEGGRAEFVLEKAFMYYVNDIPHYVPEGFIFDGASIPRGLWNLFEPNHPRHMAAACIHDFLYSSELYNRKICDKLFYLFLIERGVNKCKAWIMYKAVDLFGGFAMDGKRIVETRNMIGINDYKKRPLFNEITYLFEGMK